MLRSRDNEIEREFLGIGWAFPLRLTVQGGFAMSRGEQDIREAIWIILGTAKGERVMRPDFGCGIHDFVFAPNNPSTRAQICDQVRQALVTYEPRIDVLDVRVESFAEEPNRLLIRVDYRVRSTNTVGNLVYPFFLTEGGE
jgi:Bacteriophage baseplate protein W